MTISEGRQSSAEVADEADDLRAGLAHTLGQLRDNLRPENVVDEVVSNARIGASTLVDRVMDIARANPTPALLIGMGATMLLGFGARTISKPGSDPLPPAPLRRHPGKLPLAVNPDALRAEPDAAGFRPSASSPERVSTIMTTSLNTARTARPFAPSRLSGILDEQPLILAALGVAVGAAIGAVLPTTRIEDDWVGGASSSVRHAAQDAARSEIDDLADVASRAAENLKHSAAERGASTDNINGFVRDVGQEAKSAIHEVGDRLKPAHQDS